MPCREECCAARWLEARTRRESAGDAGEGADEAQLRREVEEGRGRWSWGAGGGCCCEECCAARWRVASERGVGPVSYTHLTLPTNREV